jgi:peptidoglycan LD-endopeptidase CwlK
VLLGAVLLLIDYLESKMTFKLSQRSLDRMKGVDERLVNVVKRAIEISEVDFMVTEGLRTEARQKQLVAAGASKTMKSKHLVGKAVDLAAVVGGQVRWDWPLYHKIAAAMKRAAEILNVRIQWGGDWVTFKDGPHFELKE